MMAGGTSDPRQFFDREHAAFDARYGSDASFDERTAIWRGLIDRYGREGATVLDVGCGSGVFACYAATRAMHVVGIDPSARMLELAEARGRAIHLDNVTFRAGELRDVEGSFDLILCSSVLEYIADLSSAFGTLTRALAPKGYLVASLPNSRSLYRAAETAVFRLTGRPQYRGLLKSVTTPEAVAEIGARSSLRVVETRYYATQHRLRHLGRFLPERRNASLFVTVFERGDRR